MASSEKMIATEDFITRYIPQRPPMVMIGNLVSSENGKTVTSLKIREDNIFCSEGLFREAGIIENIAQTAAAGNGYLCSLEGKTPPVGFIGGIRRLTIYSLPEAGDEIFTEVILDNVVMNASLVTGRVQNKGEIIAECEMKIFLDVDTDAGKN
ncbi:MAG: hydroxymyristoyl-ACP dehydratase [Bacteroidota bacterium]|nr:hydroxymyristoyl-ACP dehydratase [Bacteroidota bacterium]